MPLILSILIHVINRILDERIGFELFFCRVEEISRYVGVQVLRSRSRKGGENRNRRSPRAGPNFEDSKGLVRCPIFDERTHHRSQKPIMMPNNRILFVQRLSDAPRSFRKKQREWTDSAA